LKEGCQKSSRKIGAKKEVLINKYLANLNGTYFPRNISFSSKQPNLARARLYQTLSTNAAGHIADNSSIMNESLNMETATVLPRRLEFAFIRSPDLLSKKITPLCEIGTEALSDRLCSRMRLLWAWVALGS